MSSVIDWENTPNPVKDNRAGLIGKAVDRYEGPLKVTGTAPYAYEVQPPSPPAYGVIRGHQWPHRRHRHRAAEAAPGSSCGPTSTFPPRDRAPSATTFTLAPAGAAVGPDLPRQQVAVVVADTLENAAAAAALVDLRFEADAQSVTFHDHYDEAVQPPGESDTEIGDFEKAFAAAPVRIDDIWRTPLQNHCQMEPCATTAWRDGDHPTVHTSVQMVRLA